ncbi:MAG TPA: methyltransferase domain-containing protein [Candidatus Binatus sp.]|jgi:ubiquinone/menaquinone biosynthesis C-methylase UbiE|nr:methyltransferase domain-containing protein [Candidatus Binatus sp.]
MDNSIPMQRVNTQEILDSDLCPPLEAAASLRDLSRMNRWFGGVATTRKLIERVAHSTGRKHFSLLEVAAGFGEVPNAAARHLARQGITLDITHLDRVPSHLLPGIRAVVADALALPFQDASFDLISCSLFAHHLEPDQLARFAAEALRVSRHAVLINDLIRHPLHLALVYAGFPLMRSYVSRFDGVASVRRAYVPEEMKRMLSACDRAASDRPQKIEISQHYLFRMGVIAWKSGATSSERVL